MNQNEIIKTICVQRASKINTCQGHCALKKSLKELDDNEKEMQNNLKEKLELVYIQNVFDYSISLDPLVRLKKENYFSSNKKPISVVISYFKPPTIFI